MTSVTTLRNDKIITFLGQKFQSNFNVICSIESNIRAFVLLNFLNSLRKRDKVIDKPRILSLFPNSFNKCNKT